MVTVTEGPSHQPGIIFLYIRCNYIKFIRFYCLLIKISYWHILFCFTKYDPLHDFSEADRTAAFETILPVQAESYQQISASTSPFVSRHMMGSSPEIPNMFFRVSSFMIAGELGASGGTTVGSSPGQKKIPSGYLT